MKKLLFIIIILQLPACAFKNSTLDVKHDPQANFKGPLQEVSALSFLPPEVTDERDVKARIGYKKNGYGMNTADILTQAPVEEIVANAITEGLVQNGHSVNKDGKLSIVATIKKFWFEFDVNIFTVEYTSEVNASLNLLDNESQQVIYSSNYSGSHSRKTGGSLNKVWEQVMSKAVDKLVEDIVYDEELAEALQ